MITAFYISSESSNWRVYLRLDIPRNTEVCTGVKAGRAVRSVKN